MLQRRRYESISISFGIDKRKCRHSEEDWNSDADFIARVMSVNRQDKEAEVAISDFVSTENKYSLDLLCGYHTHVHITGRFHKDIYPIIRSELIILSL